MKMKNFLPAALFVAAAFSGCSENKELSSGLNLDNLDTKAEIGSDFYQYACGGWIANHPLDAEHSRYGTFTQLSENNEKQIKELIIGLASKQQVKGSVAAKVADVYNLAMDEKRLNEEGAEPIRADLEMIEAIDSKADILPVMLKLNRGGVFPYFGYAVGTDMMDSDSNIFQVGQGGLSLGQKSYYFDDDEATVKIREAFKEHVVKMFVLAGYDEAMARRNMEAVMEIETRIAEKSLTPVEMRNPMASYNMMPLEDVCKLVPGIDWNNLLETIGLAGKFDRINLAHPEAVKEVAAIINEVPVEKQKAYLEWNVIDEAAGCLSDAFVEQNFDFYGRTMSGTKEMKPRWKRAVGAVNGMLGEAVGQMYVEKYFPSEAKQRMTELVRNLQSALGERIEAQEWMSDVTKAKAVDKLKAFTVKIGYPDKWKDYSNLDIDASKSYWENVKRANAFEIDKMLAKAGKPVDRDEWFMTPQTINAYYNPTTNEICFPAGILQYPFFDMNADDAFNYGAIGVVIGHEMTHGFDDQGRQFDKEGNFNNWWTNDDAEKFNARTQVMVDFFNSIEVLPGLMANGQLTLGENIADHGGLNISYQAFKNATKNNPLPKKDGYTPEQRFFLAYANVWAVNATEETMRLQTKSDPHSLGRWRVNGALPHINAWYEAWGITEEDPLYIAPEKRVNIW